MLVNVSLVDVTGQTNGGCERFCLIDCTKETALTFTKFWKDVKSAQQPWRIGGL